MEKSNLIAMFYLGLEGKGKEGRYLQVRMDEFIHMFKKTTLFGKHKTKNMVLMFWGFFLDEGF